MTPVQTESTTGGVLRTGPAVSVLEELGLDRAIFTSSGRHLFTDMDPVIWLTTFKPMSRAAVVLERGGDLTLLVDNDADLHRARRLLPQTTVEKSADPFQAAADLVTAAGSAQPTGTVGAVGLAGSGKLTASEFRSVALGGRARLIDAELDVVARSKDAFEMEMFRRATEIGEDAYHHLVENLHPGMTDVEAEALLESRCRELGAQDSFIFLSASVRNRAVQRPWGRVLMPGDVVLMEVSPSCAGIFSQICRTVSIGEPSKELVRHHQLLRDALASGIDACRPGTTVSDVVAAMDQHLIDEGLAEYCKPPFMRVRGHGMGFGSVAPGDFLSRNTTVLQPNDTFVLHPNQMLPGVGYLMCGEPVIVGSTDAAGTMVSQGIAELGVVSL